MTIFKIKSKKKRYIRLKALEKCPQKSGTCMRIYRVAPKKPNSALRKLVKAKLSNSRTLIAHIPGEGHKLLKFASVLFRGCRVRDTPGVKYRALRGVYGFNLKGLVWRVRGRSKYGAKRFPGGKNEFQDLYIARILREKKIKAEKEKEDKENKEDS